LHHYKYPQLSTGAPKDEVKQEKMDVKGYFEDFFSILSEDELVELGKKYGVEDKNKI
jgi:hypothetical protein